MNKYNMKFYNEYQNFYAMAESSKAFSCFCKDAFGSDFSQDGFSDINQINFIINEIPNKSELEILDIGCGNGKMLGYLQTLFNCNISGFDYSEIAIKTAQELHPTNSDFKVGVIGEISYKENSFDVIISMDTIYFANDMNEFVSQVRIWLKPNGIFIVGYQEGDVIPKTNSIEDTQIVKCLNDNNLSFKSQDLTYDTYILLNKKREIAIKYQHDFEREQNSEWFDMLIWQTEYANTSFDEYKEKMARYFFVAKK